MTITNLRSREIAEQAISYLIDNDLLEDFLEDRDMELTEEEKSYFGIPEEDDRYYDDPLDDPVTTEGWHQQDLIDLRRRER